VGGIVADRRSRRHIVIATQTAAMLLAFALAMLTLTRTVHVWHVFVLASSLGVVNAFDIPARQSFQVEMVGKPDLMNAPSRSTPRCSTPRASSARPSPASWWRRSAKAGASS
jgi:hypothetical protein